uniref:Peptidase S1 domain-containing protein n=1 Tax=Megaselia scalaris TaxID=36166 RepID=T1GY31_MEGSC
MIISNQQSCPSSTLMESTRTMLEGGGNGANSVEVSLGAWNLTEKNEKGRQTLVANKSCILPHEKYNSKTLLNDIALIHLPESIKFNDYIQPAKLPKFNSNGKYKNYVGEIATASGWGKTEAGRISNILLY